MSGTEGDGGRRVAEGDGCEAVRYFEYVRENEIIGELSRQYERRVLDLAIEGTKVSSILALVTFVFGVICGILLK